MSVAQREWHRQQESVSLRQHFGAFGRTALPPRPNL
jgi:hypothetical protein